MMTTQETWNPAATPVETINGTVNFDRLGVFVEALIRNYSDAPAAVLREWVSNAIDAHRAVQSNVPVEVKLPVMDDKRLIVRDKGVGMTLNDVYDTYTSLLSTAKENDNKSIGNFGIGSKSALALNERFFVSTVAEGLKNEFWVYASEAGVDAELVLKNEPTEEPSGTTAVVEVKSFNYLRDFSPHKILHTLAGWSKSEVSVLGLSEDEEKHDVRIPEVFEKTEHGWVVPTSLKARDLDEIRTKLHLSSDSVPVVIGGVFYKFGFAEFARIGAIELPINSVSFPSGREVIEGTDGNVQAIRSAGRGLAADAKKFITEQARNVATYKEGYELLYSSLYNDVATDNWGKVLEKDFEVRVDGEELSLSLKKAEVLSIYEVRLKGRGSYGEVGLGEGNFTVSALSDTLTCHFDRLGLVVLQDVAMPGLGKMRQAIRGYVMNNKSQFKNFGGRHIVVAKNEERIVAGAKRSIELSALLAYATQEARTSVRTSKEERLERALSSEVQSTAFTITAEGEAVVNLVYNKTLGNALHYAEEHDLPVVLSDERTNTYAKEQEAITLFKSGDLKSFLLVQLSGARKATSTAKLLDVEVELFEGFCNRMNKISEEKYGKDYITRLLDKPVYMYGYTRPVKKLLDRLENILGERVVGEKIYELIVEEDSTTEVAFTLIRKHNENGNLLSDTQEQQLRERYVKGEQVSPFTALDWISFGGQYYRDFESMRPAALSMRVMLEDLFERSGMNEAVRE